LHVGEARGAACAMAKPVTSGARLELAFALELQRVREARFATRRVAASHDERASAFAPAAVK
jgi:hypothetical protein